MSMKRTANPEIAKRRKRDEWAEEQRGTGAIYNVLLGRTSWVLDLHRRTSTNLLLQLIAFRACMPLEHGGSCAISGGRRACKVLWSRHYGRKHFTAPTPAAAGGVPPSVRPWMWWDTSSRGDNGMAVFRSAAFVRGHALIDCAQFSAGSVVPTPVSPMLSSRGHPFSHVRLSVCHQARRI